MADYWLYLDDYRPVPKGEKWKLARSYIEFVEMISVEGLPEYISFDHDLGDEHYGALEHPIPYDKMAEKTGYHCVNWLIEYCRVNGLKLPACDVHSMNPAGAENIKNALRKAYNDEVVSNDA